MGGFAAKPLLTNFEHDGQFNYKIELVCLHRPLSIRKSFESPIG